MDLQDIGARYYTYAGTAASLMRDAAARRKPIVVLDRPDPIGGELVQGAVRASVGDPDSDAVGFLPVPMRHGMTLGELLRMANDRLGLRAELVVVPAAGWWRAMDYDATGLPWIRPSPNMPDLESAFHYPGICLFEGTNLSVGRGTSAAFQIIGAPWLDARRLLRSVSVLDGVQVVDTEFTPHAPTDGKYDGVSLHGLRFRVTDRARYDPTRFAVALLAGLEALYPDSFQFRPTNFDRLAADSGLRRALLAHRSPADIWATWQVPLERFRLTRAKYLLY